MVEARRALRWIAWSIPAMPFAVLPHELGHFLFMRLFGLPNVRLHYGSTTHDAHQKFWSALRQGDMAVAGSIMPLSHAAISAAAGIVVSYVTIALCIYLVRTRPAHPFIVALGLVSTLRFSLGPTILFARMVQGARFYSGTDEGMVAAATGIPEALLWVVGLSCVVTAWVMIIGALPRGRRILTFVYVAAGAGLGVLIYVVFLGPRLLP